MGGGVACYIHESLKVNLLAASPNELDISPEFILLSITAPNADPLLFASMYRKPHGHMLDDFLVCLNVHLHAFKNFALAGDLNCNLLVTDYKSKYLRDFANSLAFEIIPSQATYHTSHSDSLLDVVLVDSLQKIHSFSKSASPFINGHDLLEFEYKFEIADRSERTISRRNFKRFNEAEYCTAVRDRVSKLNLQNTISCTSISELNNYTALVTSAILEPLDASAPIREMKVRRPAAPWLTNDLKLRMKQRDVAYKKAKRSNSALGYFIYRDIRNKLSADIKTAIANFYYSSLSSITDSAQMWRALDRLGLVKSSLPSPLHFFTADQLSNFYASISAGVPACSHDELESIISNAHYNGPSFSFSPTTIPEIYEIIFASPRHSYAAGADRIPLFAISTAFHEIASSLVTLFNSSLSLSYFPDDLKVSLIRALSKVRTPNSPSDTRPISNIPEPSKIFERVVHRQIVNFIENNNILDPRQSGFRTGYNTQSALLRLTDDIRRAIDERRVTILILFDFSKAFDTIRHSILLKKLSDTGFSPQALSFIHSYLSGRTQRVIEDNAALTAPQPNTCGVPQGSVLGPLLFSLFVNDIATSIKYSKHLIFADDTQTYLSCYPSQIHQALALAALDASAIADYAAANGLTLNIAKSKVLIIGSAPFVKEIYSSALPPIVINGVALPYVSEALNLGVMFSSDLSWRGQVAKISQKVHLSLFKLKHHKHSLSRELRIKLVTTLIFPIFDYCCLVYNDLSMELDAKLQVLLNNCIRFIFDLRRDVHITPYRLLLNWLSVRNRRLYFLGCLTYRILNLPTASYLRDEFLEYVRVPFRPVRSAAPSRFFSIPRHRTQTYKNSFLISSFYLWNSLPENIRMAVSLPIFKKLLFAHLIGLERLERQA